MKASLLAGLRVRIAEVAGCWATRPRSPVPLAPILAALLAGFLFPLAGAAQGPDETDIWAIPITGDGPTLDLTGVVRVTRRPGYDNQPHFPPGQRLVLYTAVDSAGQADIWSFDLRSGDRRNLTRSSPESEYSATVLPDRSRFSVVRVEADSTQRLWTFESGGTNPELLLPGAEPVGYHAWIDDDRLALFVLGSPSTLQVASRTTGETDTVAMNIGRSLHKIPGRPGFSFVQWGPDGEGEIREYDLDAGETRPLAPLLEGSEDYAWSPEGALLMAHGSALLRWIPGESQEWEEVTDLGPLGIREISRLAVNPEGTWMAVVGNTEPTEGIEVTLHGSVPTSERWTKGPNPPKLPTGTSLLFLP